jgi:enoyl-CoA hydratase
MQMHVGPGVRKSSGKIASCSSAHAKIRRMIIPSFDSLLYSIDERICTITLNRPDKLNAMSRSLLDELELAFSAAKADSSVSVVLLKGAGRAFCAGYDLAPDDWILSQYGADFEGPVDAVIDRDDVTEILERWLRLWKFPKPIIAQVQGACLSGAGELLGVADIVVAGEGAKFGHPAGRDLGIPVTLSFWPMLIGMRKTKELLFTSRLISGTEAERIGLVNQVVPDADLEDAALEMARDVARTADVGLRMSKLATNRWFENMGLMASCYSTADLDTFFHQSSTYVDFFSAVRERGMAAALQERAEKFS